MDKGAHFYRCDFQVHTPRDRQWQGEEAVSETERQKYAEEFIRYCRHEQLHAIAITDHHDMGFIPYIRNAAQTEVADNNDPVPEENRIFVFPGMELTLGIPCQALLIFDATFPDDMFKLATTCLALNPSKSTEAQCNEVVRLDHIKTFEKLYEELDKHDYLKGRYIVLPNVSEGGNSTLLRSGHAGHYKTMPCVGGYLDGKIDQLGTGNQTILSGKDIHYGQKPLALFQTSDNRRRDFRDLGTSSTRVKWAEPTAEAIRQACLARESRISQDEPLLPSIFITSISVSNSSFLGPINLEFSCQYNAIIGGRGTGKSTLLEYLRWALCDEPISTLDYEELPSYEIKRDKLIKQTLTAVKANVQVNFIINGVPHSVRRDSASNELSMKIGNGNYEPCSESDIQTLLPVQAYSQKQLSNVGVRIDELTRFIHSPIRTKLDEINVRFDKVENKLRTLYASLQQKRSYLKNIQNDELESKSLTERIATTRSRLTGISEDDQIILVQHDNYLEELKIVSTWIGQIETLKASLDSIKQVAILPFSELPDVESLPESELIRTIHREIKSVFEKINSDLDTHIALLSDKSPESLLFVSINQLKQKHEKYKKTYSAALAKSTTHSKILEELGELEERLQIINDRIMSNQTALSKSGNPETEFAQKRNEWLSLHNEQYQAIASQCDVMTTLSNGQIRARLIRGFYTNTIYEKIKEAFAGLNIRGSKIEKLCEIISSDAEPVRKYHTICDELENLALHDTDKPTINVMPQTPNLSSAGFNATEIERIAERLTTKDWIDLFLLRIDDAPVFEYKTREDEYIPFSDASAGQQATSLLTVLLNQVGIPLIIDQPEDDLDNKVIPAIVEQIWKAKQARQLIFSSHNANLVVNGDAELVACFDYRVAGEQSSGQIRYEGAIDIKDIREEITNVMEGGREAFNLRKQKYGF